MRPPDLIAHPVFMLRVLMVAEKGSSYKVVHLVFT